MHRESFSRPQRRASRQPRQTRRAITLIEIMVVVTLTSIIVGVAISFLVAVRQWDRKLRDGRVRIDQTARLAQLMRADIRQATSVSLPTEKTLAITSSGTAQTRYEVTAEGCRRIVGVAGGAASSTDLFSIAPAVSWALEHGPPGRRPMIIVTLLRAAAADDPTARPAPFLVYAALGADLMPMEPTADESASPTP